MPPQLKRFLRRPQVEDLTGLSTSTIYEKMAKGEFPKPINLSPQRVAWIEDDIAAWMDAKIADAPRVRAEAKAKHAEANALEALGRQRFGKNPKAA